MAKRPGRTMRKKKRPYTRVSKKKPKEGYVAGAPRPKIGLFEMGKKEGDFDRVLYLIAKRGVQIRDSALEAARIVIHKFLEEKIGKNYFLKVLVYPHQIIREQSIATGAGADRYSQGMRKSFGRPVGRAARVDEGQRVISLKIKKENLKAAKEALKRAGSKLPTPVRIEIKK